MTQIQTTTGWLNPDLLRFCHSHEHLFITKGKSYEINPDLWMDDYDKSLQELQDFSLSGGTTIVDAQPGGCGRNADALKNLSLYSGVQIVASTGFHKMEFYPDNHWIFQYDLDTLADIFIHEVQTGMYVDCDSSAPHNYIDAKAGIIKCALDKPGLESQYQKLFAAAACAANQTGAPLMIHIEKGSDSLSLTEYLISQNVDLNRVIFCHMDRACQDINVHKSLCEQGIYMEYDTIGRFKYHDDGTEAGIFFEMIHSGFEDRLLFGLDTTRKRLKSYTPDSIGLTYIMKSFIPLLRKFGIANKQIDKISRYNCQNILSIRNGKE